jgi:hypothetical protein
MTNNKQQTAVEWLQSIELERDLTLADWKQAKEMEKEQTIDFAMKFMMQDRPVVSYYNETYGGGEQ